MSLSFSPPPVVSSPCDIYNMLTHNFLVWSNFEIADMDFFRSKAYMEYFDHLDRAGGFYYEVCISVLFHFFTSFGFSSLLSCPSMSVHALSHFSHSFLPHVRLPHLLTTSFSLSLFVNSFPHILIHISIALGRRSCALCRDRAHVEQRSSALLRRYWLPA
jgi:hypothetical protein